MQKILVTGATGFLGKNILEKINYQKYEVWIIARREQMLGEHIHTEICDLRDIEASERVVKHIKADILVMLAWDVNTQTYWEAFENHIWADSSIKVAESFIEAGGKQILFAGTSASYNYGFGYLKENIVYENPDSFYGIAKLYASRIIKKLSDKHGVIFCEARLFAIYGKYERTDRLVPTTILKLLDSQQIINAKGDLIRDYIYVEDAADAILFLLKQEEKGVFNISSGKPISIKEIIMEIALLLNRSFNVSFEKTIIDNEHPFIVGDNSRLKNLGFQYGFNIERGLRETIDWIGGKFE